MSKTNAERLSDLETTLADLTEKLGAAVQDGTRETEALTANVADLKRLLALLDATIAGVAAEASEQFEAMATATGADVARLDERIDKLDTGADPGIAAGDQAGELEVGDLEAGELEAGVSATTPAPTASSVRQS